MAPQTDNNKITADQLHTLLETLKTRKKAADQQKWLTARQNSDLELLVNENMWWSQQTPEGDLTKCVGGRKYADAIFLNNWHNTNPDSGYGDLIDKITQYCEQNKIRRADTAVDTMFLQLIDELQTHGFKTFKKETNKAGRYIYLMTKKMYDLEVTPGLDRTTRQTAIDFFLQESYR